MVVSSGACPASTSEAITITVNPVSVVKTISGAGAICNGDTKTLTLATGSVGAIQWQSSTTSATATDFADINGATNPVSLIVSPTVTTWYRAVASNGVCSAATSAAIKITVSQPTAVGTLAAVATTLCTGTGTTITLGTSNGTVAWYKSTNYVNTTGAAIVWTLVPLSATVTSTTLATGNLTYVAAAPITWYKAIATNGVCSATTSNIVSVTVSPPATATTVSGNALATTLATAVCSGARTLTLATGSQGAIQWQFYNAGTSTTAVTNTTAVVWTDIAGANSTTYNAVSSLAVNVWFRVKLTGPCATLAYSTPVNVWFKACATTVRAEETPLEFKAIAYPNPFAENFKLEVKTSSEEVLQVKIYDMLGKFIDNRILQTTEIEGFEIGANYPTGVYNVIVSQGENVKILRVIKR